MTARVGWRRLRAPLKVSAREAGDGSPYAMLSTVHRAVSQTRRTAAPGQDGTAFPSARGGARGQPARCSQQSGERGWRREEGGPVEVWVKGCSAVGVLNRVWVCGERCAVIALRLYGTHLNSGHSTGCTIKASVHPCTHSHTHTFTHTHTHTHTRATAESATRGATASWSGAVRVRWCLAQGHLRTRR